MKKLTIIQFHGLPPLSRSPRIQSHKYTPNSCLYMLASSVGHSICNVFIISRPSTLYCFNGVVVKRQLAAD